MKTTADIEQDIYSVATAFLEGRIGGSVYKGGTRPKDSSMEDAAIVVSFASTGQRQDASAYVNIFVPDTASGHGETLPDTARLRQVASLGDGLAEALSNTYSDYQAALGSATDILEGQDTGQHIVSIHLSLTINTI